jgi:DNA-binding NarL/FixJ family response regulator
VSSPKGSILTQREIEVLRLVADGMSTKEIAYELGIAFKTASCHRLRILGKLGARNSVAAARAAIRMGIVEA